MAYETFKTVLNGTKTALRLMKQGEVINENTFYKPLHSEKWCKSFNFGQSISEQNKEMKYAMKCGGLFML